MSIEIPSHLTSAERDLLTNVAAGSSFFNTDLNRIQGTFDGGATPSWNVEACIEDIKLQTAYDNDPVITLASLTNLTVNDSGSNPLFSVVEGGFFPGASFYKNLVLSDSDVAGPNFLVTNTKNGAVSDNIASLKTISYASNSNQKQLTLLQQTVSDASTATYSTDTLSQGWSFGSLVDAWSFKGVERSLYTAPVLTVQGDSLVDPRIVFNNPVDGDSSSVLVRSISKADNGDEKSQVWINKSVQDTTSAGYSTSTSITDWWNGAQRGWLSTDPINETVTILGQLTVRQNDPTYGQSTSVEDFIFQEGRLINFNGPGTASGTQLSSSVTADEAITSGSVVAISPSTDFRAVNHPITGTDSVIGVSTTEAINPGNIIQYCYVGDADIQLEDGTGCVRGDLLVPSDVTPGRAVVNNDPGHRQSFASAWETVALATPGPMARCRIGIADVDDGPSQESYGEIHFQGNATQTAMTLNVNTIPAIPAIGGYNEGVTTSDFELGAFSGSPTLDNALKYTGVSDRTFKITATIAVKNVSGAEDDGSFYIAKNAIVLLDSCMSRSVGNEPGSITIQSIETLSTNDVFQVTMKNTLNNDDWICVDLNLIATAID